jgi:dienelactone hydrolase
MTTRGFPSIRVLLIGVALGASLLAIGPCPVRGVSAQAPEDSSVPGDGEVIGVASDALDCLAIGRGVLGEASGIARVTWQGQVERARLIVRVSGAEAAHTIRVNGRPAARVPVHPDGQTCGDGEIFYLDIPSEVVVQGDNVIEITDDGLAGDSWSAADVRLEVLGHIRIDIRPGAEQTEPTGVSAIEATNLTIEFASSYDGTTQQARAQIPGGGGSGSRPLLVFVHARNGDMYDGEEEFGAAVDGRGWLMVSPQLHGSWPDPPSPPGKYAYASLESQYDAVDAARYMVENYNVKTDQIYIAGYSMGGQGTVVTAAKFPHLFAAVFSNKGPTDMVEWYDEQVEYYTQHGDGENQVQVVAMREECHIGGFPKYPVQNPFCYQRRSGIQFANNYVHMPIWMTHSISDALVPIHHSRDLRDAINSSGPDQPAGLFEDAVVGPTCPPHHHCYEPDPVDVLDFLEPFTLDNNPTHIRITTDESKSYYWMNLAQTGDDHWSHIEAATYPISATVTAIVTDTEVLALGFNLSSTPTAGVVEQPGIGLPATAYLVKGGGNNFLQEYTSGYLTATLASTGPSTLTISAVAAEVWADPPIVQPAQPARSTITVSARDHLENPVPDGTTIELSTTEGIFPGGGSTYAAATLGGQAAAILSLGPAAKVAEVTARLGSVSGMTSVYVRNIALLASADPAVIENGQTVTYTYRITNTGGITLTGVTLVDDNGTPGSAADDLTVCQNITLTAGASTSCSRTARLFRTATSTAVVTGQDPLGDDVADSDSVTVELESYMIYLPVLVKNG